MGPIDRPPPPILVKSTPPSLHRTPQQAVLLCWEREAGELCVLDLYSFEHDAIGLGSAVRAEPPDVDRPEGELRSGHRLF